MENGDARTVREAALEVTLKARGAPSAVAVRRKRGFLTAMEDALDFSSVIKPTMGVGCATLHDSEREMEKRRRVYLEAVQNTE